MTGYSATEAVGATPGILKSGRQPPEFYKDMWRQLASTGHWQGEIWNRKKTGELYAEFLTINTIYSADGSAHRRVGLFSDITEKKASDDLIWRQANFDSLTGLPNRRMFHDRLEQEMKKAVRTGGGLALLFVDLDRFKEINDTLGHDRGDLLLVEAATRLRRCVREVDTLARLGGDEFTAIITELTEAKDAERVANKILESLSAPFVLDGHQAHISASIGITTFPHDGDTLEALLKNADRAMYAAKNQGRNCAKYFAQPIKPVADPPNR